MIAKLTLQTGRARVTGNVIHQLVINYLNGRRGGSMLSSAQGFLTLMVEPTVSEFMKAPHDIRRGLLAALVLNHLADHVAMEECYSTNREAMNLELKRVRDEMRVLCPDIQFIQNVADATKHAKLAVRKSPKSVALDLSSSAQLSSTPGLFEAPFGEGAFLEAVTVYAILNDGSTRQLLPAVESVLSAWRLKLLS